MMWRPTLTIAVLACFAAFSGCGSSDTQTPSSDSGAAAGMAGPAAVLDAPDRRDLDPRRYDGADVTTVTRPVKHAEVADEPKVVLSTSLGDITLKLYRDRTPLTADNFVEYVVSGFYDGTIVHQVEDGFIIAAGGYTPDLKLKRPRLPIRNEAHRGGPNRRATVAMVRFDEVDSATSQFLINLADNKDLDHKSREVPGGGKPDQFGFCVFGEVTDGWPVVEKIAQAKTNSAGGLPAVPVQPIVIRSARLETRSTAPSRRMQTVRDPNRKRYE